MDRNEFKLAEVKRKCPICRRLYTGCGHNAIPVWPGRCCDRCFKDYVIPMRMKLIEETMNKTKGK